MGRCAAVGRDGPAVPQDEKTVANHNIRQVVEVFDQKDLKQRLALKQRRLEGHLREFLDNCTPAPSLADVWGWLCLYQTAERRPLWQICRNPVQGLPGNSSPWPVFAELSRDNFLG